MYKWKRADDTHFCLYLSIPSACLPGSALAAFQILWWYLKSAEVWVGKQEGCHLGTGDFNISTLLCCFYAATKQSLKVSSVHAIFSMSGKIYFYIYKAKQALGGCQLPPDVKNTSTWKEWVKTSELCEIVKCRAQTWVVKLFSKAIWGCLCARSCWF